MTKAQAKKRCRELHNGKRRTENFYLIKYRLEGWVIGTPEEFSNANKRAVDFELYTL